MPLFCYALLYVLSSFAIILKRKRELVALLLLSCGCLATLNVLLLFLTVPWVGLTCVIVVFPDHTHLPLLKRGFTRYSSTMKLMRICRDTITTLVPMKYHKHTYY